MNNAFNLATCKREDEDDFDCGKHVFNPTPIHDWLRIFLITIAISLVIGGIVALIIMW